MTTPPRHAVPTLLANGRAATATTPRRVLRAGRLLLLVCLLSITIGCGARAGREATVPETTTPLPDPASRKNIDSGEQSATATRPLER